MIIYQLVNKTKERSACCVQKTSSKAACQYETWDYKYYFHNPLFQPTVSVLLSAFTSPKVMKSLTALYIKTGLLLMNSFPVQGLLAETPCSYSTTLPVRNKYR